MLTHPLRNLLDWAFLRLSGGDAIRADELRARVTASFLAFMMASYLPLAGAVLLLVVHRPQPVDENAARDQMTMVEDYSMRYVNTYLKDPSNTAAIKEFYDGDVPASALPPGGRALWAASALPGVMVDGFRTYSVIVTAEIPKAANSASMVPIKLQTYISADTTNRLRAVALPFNRADRPSGKPVELATSLLVSEDRPVYSTVSGFLSAMLTGVGDITPYVAYGSSLTASKPPRFTTLSIERVQTNSELATAQSVPPKASDIEVNIRAIGQTPSGVLMPMDFPLVMSVAAGHWQVDRINDSPSILTPNDSDSDSSTTTPTTTSTPATTAPGFTSSTTSEGN
ncbi:hypothetical protein [Mycolicibacterium fortuitum]|uniref:hypothetical protein n=1 Tax=Mycolicibacterium fortuitum TaxID=1766 RepID=UPI003AAF054C